MKTDPQNPGRPFVRGLLIFVFAVSSSVSLILLSVFTADAQSGRRLPKAASSTAQPTPETKPAASSQRSEKKKVSITLGINGHEMFNVPLSFYDSILASCADRLQEAPSVQLNVSGRDMNRGDAIKLAKSQKEGYVALLELRSDSRGASNASYEELYLEYSVFAPETAKIAASGRAYQRVLKNRGVILNPRPPGGSSAVYIEQMLRQAARDAADKILSALHLVLPDNTIPNAY